MRRILLLLLAAIGCGAQSIEDRVDRIFETYNKPGTPGCSVGVLRDGQFLLKRGYGYANLEHGIPLSSTSVLDIGSTSKQFVGLAALMLEQEGKIKLDDDIREHLPEMPGYARPVTIRQMLQHTSGLRDYLGLFQLAGRGPDDFYTDDDVVAMLARQKSLNFTPGSDWLYSNSGYFLISQLVKRTAHTSLRQYAEAKIFAPLGMKNTHFHDDHTMVVPNRATGYSPAHNGGFRVSMSNLDMVGDGGVYTTVEDKWDANFYSRTAGGPLVGALQAPGPRRGTGHYALGLFLGEFRGAKTVRHGGSWAGYRAELLRFPEYKFSVICLCNRGDADPSHLADQVAGVYLEPLLKPAPVLEPAKTVTLGGDVIRQYAGAYWNPRTDDLMQVVLQGNSLAVVRGPRTVPLLPVSPAEFRMDNLSLQFHAQGLRLRSGEGTPAEYERATIAEPSEAGKKAIAGRYFSEELDAEWVIAWENGVLRLKQRNAPRLPLQPGRAPGEWRLANNTLTFDSSGFVLNAGRVRNLRFVKR
ncbi:MAG: beta-lactamase family protein [Bryobacteraceae bacterium]|nr:beta-lactamase family protein [Bryobacteraceae bacterium]